MWKIIKSTLIADLSNTNGLLSQKFRCVYQTIFIDKLGKGFIGDLFEIPTERWHGHANFIGNFF